MDDNDLQNFPATTSAIDSVLNQAASKGLDKLKDKNPILGDIAGGLLGKVFPGFGGTQGNFGSTVFDNMIKNKIAQSVAEKKSQIDVAIKDISTSPKNLNVHDIDKDYHEIEDLFLNNCIYTNFLII